MDAYVALLRAINLGGNTSLPMAELRSICEEAGLSKVRTYIQSGNVLFESDKSEASLVRILEDSLENKKARHIPVVIRTGKELEDVLSRNPFPHAVPAKIGVLFFREVLPDDILKDLNIPGREEVVVSGREFIIHYPDGMGRSKLKFPKAASGGTMRNMNTVAKLAKLSRE